MNVFEVVKVRDFEVLDDVESSDRIYMYMNSVSFPVGYEEK